MEGWDLDWAAQELTSQRSRQWNRRRLGFKALNRSSNNIFYGKSLMCWWMARGKSISYIEALLSLVQSIALSWWRKVWGTDSSPHSIPTSTKTLADSVSYFKPEELTERQTLPLSTSNSLECFPLQLDFRAKLLQIQQFATKSGKQQQHKNKNRAWKK